MILENTQILKVSKNLTEKDDIEKLSFAADIIRKGGTVCFPTETVYGLGANALDSKACEQIFEAKGRPQDNPLIIHLDNADKAENYCHTKDSAGFVKLKHLMPGPLTVILPKKDCIPMTVTANLPNVALRVPENKVAHKFLELCDVPVAAPSANISGKPSPTKAQHVIDDLFSKVDVIIDGGDCDVGLESTIVTLATEPPTLLRPGAVTFEALCDTLGKVDVAQSVLSEMRPDEKAAAPGMKYKHYAPCTPVYLLAGDDDKVKEYILLLSDSDKCALILFSEDIKALSGNINPEAKIIMDMGAKDDIPSHAHAIFSHLRDTDKIPELDKVFVRITGDKSGLNLAVFNRLLKAAAYKIIEL